MRFSPARTITAVDPQARCIRVLLVDDSIVVRSIVERILESDPRLEIVASVATAPEALAVLDKHKVDAVLLDLEMPVMHGLEAIPLILAKQADARIIILSANCEDGGPAAVQALSLGAADTLLKPGKVVFAGRFGATLIERLSALSADRGWAGGARPAQASALPKASEAIAARPVGAVAVGASTGGIMAINQLLTALPDWLDAPLFITQHLPAGFIRYFADQLQRMSARPVHVAADGMMVESGHIYLAPGDGHLGLMPIAGGYRILLDHTMASSGACPSVDVMLASLAQAYGPLLCGVMLTGMGRDGLEGARKLCAAGGVLLAQNLTSSVVWGMPGAVVREGLAQAQGDPVALAKLIGRVAKGVRT